MEGSIVAQQVQEAMTLLGVGESFKKLLTDWARRVPFRLWGKALKVFPLLRGRIKWGATVKYFIKMLQQPWTGFWDTLLREQGTKRGEETIDSSSLKETPLRERWSSRPQPVPRWNIPILSLFTPEAEEAGRAWRASLEGGATS